MTPIKIMLSLSDGKLRAAYFDGPVEVLFIDHDSFEPINADIELNTLHTNYKDPYEEAACSEDADDFRTIVGSHYFRNQTNFINKPVVNHE